MLEFILSHISVQELIWLTVFLPFIGFVINGIISLASTQYRITEPRTLVVLVSQLSVILSFVAVILVWYILLGLESGSPSVITGPILSWKGFLNQPLEFGLKADQLSLAIALSIGFIGVAVHIYSLGYLRDRNISGYFSLLNLIFSFGLILVFTDSFFLFFVVWQLIAVIGLVFVSRSFTDKDGIRRANICYLFEILSGAAFLLLMFLVWKAVDGQAGLDIFQFSSVQNTSLLLLPYASVVSFALLFGVMIRSLQFPFYVWITEGITSPLPVFAFLYAVLSSLVSIYILIRFNFLLILSLDVLQAAAVVGAIGCLYGALAAIVQKDAKKVLSYFALSQVGLAFVGVGVGAFAAAVFHMVTNAFYITALFLGVGSLISIVGNDEIDQGRGLRKLLPVTFWTTLFGAFAASGIYPFAGFFGKNAVLWEAYQRGHGLLFLAAFLASIFGAIAIFRMVALFFFGKMRREDRGRFEESSVSMLVTLVLVAFVSLVVGWLGVGKAFGGEDHFGRWLEPGLATQMVHVLGEGGRFSEVVLAVITTLFSAHAGLVTWIIYVQKKRWPDQLAARFKNVYSLLVNGFYLNDFYKIVIARPIALASEYLLWRGLDNLVIDGVIVGSVGRTINLKARMVERFKAASIQSYLFWIVVLLIVLIGWAVF